MRKMLLSLGLAVLVAAPCGAQAPGGAAGPGKLTLNPQAAMQAQLGYYPVPVKLVAERPAAVKKEPAYRGTPKYAVLRVGNGPKADYVVALDEPEGSDFKIYVDANRNGDLTDDGDGAWSKKNENNGRVVYGVNNVVLRGSWGTADRETSSGPYGLGLYRIVGVDPLLTYRQGGRAGTVTAGGKSYKAVLVENDADGLFNKPVTDASQAQKTRPVWLLLDLNNDGKFDSRGDNPELFDIRAPFKMGAKTYEAKVAADGSTLALVTTTKAALDLTPKAPPRPELLKAGVAAPDFAVEKWGGGDLKLSDYRGKVVILDFWATWCPPCQKSMPHLEKVWQAVQGQDVAVLAVCVWDEKKAYEQWIPANKEKYSYTFGFDPAGRSDANIAAKHYKVSGIPTTYIIDKEGKVAEAIVGYDDGDTRVEAALKKLGVKVE